MKSYFETDGVTLYHGDMREVLPALGGRADLVCTDPPYGETNLAWDRWVDGWPALAAAAGSSMWCFGSFRMYQKHGSEFADWKFSQDVVWEKHNGSGMHADRFRRVHELVVHWYRGAWGECYKHPPTVRLPDVDPRSRRAPRPARRPAQFGTQTPGRDDDYRDDGTRLIRSVFRAKQIQGGGPTQKPVGILAALIEYACPPGGLVLDLFGGRGSTAVAARQLGRRATLIEADERECEHAARRLAQGSLDLAATP